MGRRAHALAVTWILLASHPPAPALGDAPCGPRPAPGWPVILGNGIHATPAVSDVDGDGRDEIAVTLRDGRVFLLDGDGSSCPGWPRSTTNSVTTSPALGDVDGDGRGDVVAASRDGSAYAWRVDGTPVEGWPVDLGAIPVSAPVFIEPPGSGILFTTADGRVHLLDAAGAARPGWPRAGAPRRAQYWDQACTRSSDVDGDGEPEVVHLDGDGTVHVWRLDGSRMPGFPTELREAGVGLAEDPPRETPIVCTTSRHVVVIDGKGRARARLSAGRESFTSPPTVFSVMPRPPMVPLVAAATEAGSIHVGWLDGTPVEGWPVHLSGFIYGIGTEEERFAVYGPPVVWDVDEDGALEIVVGSYDQHLYAFELDGRPVAAWPLTLDDAIIGSPCFADVDGNGRQEMLVGQAGETLFAFRLGSGGWLTADPRTGRVRAAREWPLAYCAVACAVLALAALIVVRLRGHLSAYGNHVATRSPWWQATAVVLVLLLIGRLTLLASEIQRYRHGMDQLDASRGIVRGLMRSEQEALERQCAGFAAQLESHEGQGPRDPIRIMYEMERLADRARLDYRQTGLMVTDASGYVIQAVGAIQAYSRIPVPPSISGNTAAEAFVVENKPGFLVSRPLDGSYRGQWLHFWSSLAGSFPQRLADATGVAVIMKLDDQPVARSGTARGTPNTGWPYLGVVKPARELSITREPAVSAQLILDGYRALPTGGLDLAIFVVLPFLLYLGNLESVEARLPRRFAWWLPAVVGIHLTGWLLLWGRVFVGRTVALAGHALGWSLHVLGLAAIGYALPRFVQPGIGKRLRFVLLVSYLFVGLLPLTVALVIATRSLQEAQREIARDAVEEIQDRADHLLLAYIGNHRFEGELHRAAQRMATRSTEGGWFDFVSTTQYLFTYDLPSAYITLSAHDRGDPSQHFTGYSWRAPRSDKLYEPRPHWAGSQPVRGLFLTAGTATVHAMRTFRTSQIEARLVSHVPLDATILSSLEDRLRILPFLPRVQLQLASSAVSQRSSRRPGVPLPFSTDLVLPARDWTSGAPRWVEVRAAAFLPVNHELWRILAALGLFVLLPLGLSVWGAFFAYRRTARPLERLLIGLRRVEAGDLDYRLGTTGQTEVAAGAQAFDRMVSSLKRTVGTLAEKKKLEEISALKSRFISMVSHDLKTPLASIQGAAENIVGELAGPVTSRQRTYLEMILSSSSMLQQMISDLLDLSRIESGHLLLEPETLDLRREIEDALRSLGALVENRGLEVEIFQALDPALVRADGMRLWQILNNILANAVRHSPHGGVLRIQIEKEPAGADGGSPAIRATVSDEGPGIPVDAVGHVFEPFFHRPRAEGSAAGAGLGLAIVKQLVELHGGRVAIAVPGTGGTALSFSLPAARPREAASAASAQESANPARGERGVPRPRAR